MISAEPKPEVVPPLDEAYVASRPSITRSSKWVLAGTFLSKPIQLFTNVLVARMLGPASFGVLGLASSLAVTLSLMASLGLGDAVNKYLAEYYQKDREEGARFASVIIWTAIGGTGIFLLFLWAIRHLWIGRVFPASTSLRVIALCLCLALMNLLFALLAGIFSGLQKFREFAILNLLQSIAIAIFAVFLVVFGSEGAILAYAAGTFISVLWGFAQLWLSERRILQWPGFGAFRKLKTILSFSVPIWVGAFALAPFVTFTLAFLVHQTNGAYQLGLFNTANGLRMLVTLLPGAIAIVIAPAILQEGGRHGEKGAYAQLLNKSFSALIFLTLPFLIPCLFLSDLIFTVYGKAYGESFRLFMPLTASAAIVAIGTPLTTVMMAKNKTWWGLFFGLLKSILMVVLTVLWVPTYLAGGLTWAVVISEIALYVLVMEFCLRIEALPRGLRWQFYSSILLVLLVMTLSMFLPQIARWVLAGPLTGALLVFYLRTHVEMAGWLTSLVPAPLKPRAESILSFITTG